MRRSLLFALIIIVASLAQPRSAEALWCQSDPVFSLNLTVVDITVAVPLEYVPYVSGAVRYTLQTPPSVARKLIVNDVGYNAHGVTVRFTNRIGGISGKKFLTTVIVTVPIDTTKLPTGTVVPTVLTVFPHNGTRLQVSGKAQSTVMTLWITGLL